VLNNALPATRSGSCENVNMLVRKKRAITSVRDIVVLGYVSGFNFFTENPLLNFFESIQKSPVKNQAQK